MAPTLLGTRPCHVLCMVQSTCLRSAAHLFRTMMYITGTLMYSSIDSVVVVLTGSFLFLPFIP